MSQSQVATQREDLIGALFGLALVGGVLSDAWAHVNVLSTLESFFTPWHALLYGGFAGTAAWTWWLAFRHRRRDQRWWANAWPAGYAIGAIGSLIFLVGGAADMFWHQIFGIETSLRITMSPSHMMLAAGGALLLTSQMRSWWVSGEGGLRAVTGVLSAALGTMMGTILIIGMTGANTIAPTREYVVAAAGSASTSSGAAQGIQAYLLGTVVILVPVMLMLRRRATPVLATGVAGVIGVFLMVEHQFPMPLSGALIGMIAGAALADAVVYRLDRQRGVDAPMRLPIAGAIIAGALWAGHLIGLQLAAGIRWPVELWVGVVVLTAVLGAVLGTLSRGPSRS
ncbi:hypothetical protein Rhe02_02620 [Rhizocola hellebori]|uniref:Uncharacterized protein n=1 Tax=Rhizocola hellebori TaxID=1392758 RepID=A0A8J3Q2N7_9ACTN|nr:hypothetical protein Rhe02_02620 [Rhizocola hellebori]